MDKFKFSIFSCLLAAMFYAPIAAAECVVSGCNGEICTESSKAAMGVCLWKPEYECFHQFGVCSADLDGLCRWEDNPQLSECIENSKQELSDHRYTISE